MSMRLLSLSMTTYEYFFVDCILLGTANSNSNSITFCPNTGARNPGNSEMDTIRLIDAGDPGGSYSTKSVDIHDKSSDWGPQRGSVPVDPFFSKKLDGAWSYYYPRDFPATTRI